jgi:uncharacterized protein (TIGR02145 family)
MAENLKTIVYANGDTIPNISNDDQWYDQTTGAFASYNNNNQNQNTYGILYNWFAISDPRKVCPTGWHVPSDAEWDILIAYLDPSSNLPVNGTQSIIAGGKMKSTGTQHWYFPNSYATNQSGFSGLPGGGRSLFGDFVNLNLYGTWWSSTQKSSIDVWNRTLSYNNGEVIRSGSFMGQGSSVRCIKD